MRIIDGETGELGRWIEDLERRRDNRDAVAGATAQRIVEDVRIRGDEGVADSVAELDGVRFAPDELLVAPSSGMVSQELAAAVELAIARITRFHEGQKPRSFVIDDGDTRLQQDVRPLRRVGIYVPGGAATYISSLMMCAIPARLAGVGEIIVATTPSAAASPALNYVCTVLGIREMYRAGGAAAIAAMAFGTGSLRRVDKIAGPGNAWVGAAKEFVRAWVGIDLVAGPSEIVVLADEAADVELVVADLLAQAEHGADSVPIFVTTSRRIAREVSDRIEQQLRTAPAAAAAMRSNAAIIVVRDLPAACALVDRLAPEHLELMIRDPEAALETIDNCAAIYVGASSGVALGDYAVGTNHVLPTGGSARYSSPLGVYDFVKRRSVVRLGEQTGALVGAAAAILATAEGLPLHARSCELRAVTAERRAR